MNVSVDGSESDKYQYRMYLLASDTHLDRSGFNMNEEQLYEDELTKIRYILHRSRDQQGLFYVDIAFADFDGTGNYLDPNHRYSIPFRHTRRLGDGLD